MKRLFVGLMAMGILAAALAGCGAGTSSQASSGQVTLRCTQREQGMLVDASPLTLSCNVSNAPASATSFQLHYTLNPQGQQAHSYDSVCAGTLHNGAGSCTQIYTVIAPLSPTDAHVSGALMPGNTPLGPVTPTLVSATK